MGVVKVKHPNYSPLFEEITLKRLQQAEQAVKTCEANLRRARELVKKLRETRARSRQLRKTA